MYNKKILKPKYKYQRPILTEMIPFEVPPSFSKGGFFDLLTKYNVRIDQKGDELRRCCMDRLTSDTEGFCFIQGSVIAAQVQCRPS
jgi:hypothetical protein